MSKYVANGVIAVASIVVTCWLLWLSNPQLVFSERNAASSQLGFSAYSLSPVLDSLHNSLRSAHGRHRSDVLWYPALGIDMEAPVCTDERVDKLRRKLISAIPYNPLSAWMESWGSPPYHGWDPRAVMNATRLTVSHVTGIAAHIRSVAPHIDERQPRVAMIGMSTFNSWIAIETIRAGGRVAIVSPHDASLLAFLKSCEELHPIDDTCARRLAMVRAIAGRTNAKLRTAAEFWVTEDDTIATKEVPAAHRMSAVDVFSEIRQQTFTTRLSHPVVFEVLTVDTSVPFMAAAVDLAVQELLQPSTVHTVLLNSRSLVNATAEVRAAVLSSLLPLTLHLQSVKPIVIGAVVGSSCAGLGRAASARQPTATIFPSNLVEPLPLDEHTLRRFAYADAPCLMWVSLQLVMERLRAGAADMEAERVEEQRSRAAGDSDAVSLPLVVKFLVAGVAVATGAVLLAGISKNCRRKNNRVATRGLGIV